MIKKITRAVIISLSVVGILVLFLLAHLTPLDELMGISQSSFDEDASAGLPDSAYRIMRYSTGFADTARWISYSADKSDIEQVVRQLTEMKIEELDVWKQGASSPVGRPARNRERNKGYWDIERIAEGRKFYQYDRNKVTGIIVDTIRWRIYIYEAF